jgi:prepilin peptidase CpaA
MNLMLPAVSPAWICALGLAAWLLIAAVTDWRQRRIPNLVVAAGMLSGLAVQALAPPGQGLFAFGWGGLGIGASLLGILAGLALFLPLYLLRAVGAGDVKLLAMVGAWLGPQHLLLAALLTLLAGGVLSLAAMLLSRSSRQVLANVQVLLTTSAIAAQLGQRPAQQAPVLTGVRLPYALAIAVGSLADVAWLLLRSGP